MTTPIPPGIECPNTVNTRFGTLNFFDGFPDNASVQKIYDNLDFQRAVQAYLLALPALNQAGMRKGTLALGPANTTVPYIEKPMDSTAIFLTAAIEVYSGMWLDLSDGPLVFEAPPAVAGSINDMWYRWVADVGLTGADKGNGGKYLILPPGYSGSTPKRLLCRSAANLQQLAVLAQRPNQRIPGAQHGCGQEVHAHLPPIRSLQPAAIEFHQHVRKALVYCRSGRLHFMGDA